MGFGDTSKKDKQKAAAGAAAASAKEAAEAADWADKDKGKASKDARAADKASAADDKAAKKAELKALEEAENAEAATMKGANKQASTKVTQAEIQRRQALLAMAKGAPKKSAKSTAVAQPKLQENTNRGGDDIEATGIDAALDAMGAGEKKGKMTYKEFEKRAIEEIQSENPGLKMTQVKDKAFKMWERSPENPKNQA
mmetsp:Transcript_10208/g.30304  ORF Transcript_10208/g.30304 Transcript_10208/m.30304 type:complete len:198 (-) Transcript_10208:88-681(-)